jgi:hypothetical protein
MNNSLFFRLIAATIFLGIMVVRPVFSQLTTDREIQAMPRFMMNVEHNEAMRERSAVHRDVSFLGSGLEFCPRLTSDGRHVVVYKTGRELSVVRTDDMSETIISKDLRCLAAWVDTQRNGFFVVMADEEADVSKPTHRNKELKMETWYFENLDDLIAWKPKWKLPGFACESSFQWLESVKLWAIYQYKVVSRREHFVYLADETGKIVGKFEVQGRVFGMEVGENGRLEIYYATSTKGDVEWRVRRGVVHSDQQRLESHREIYRMDVPSHKGTYLWGFNRGIFDSRLFRFRGLKDGDVRTFAVEILRETSFFTHQDSGKTISSDSYNRSGLFQIKGQFSNQGIVSCRENEHELELVRTAHMPAMETNA